LLLGAHFGILLLASILYFLGGFSLEEFTTIAAIVAPLFAGYSSSIVAFFIADRHQLNDVTNTVTNTYAALVISLPLLLVAMVGLCLILKAYNLAFPNFEAMKRFILLFESLSGVYVGMLVYSLFARTPPPAPRGQRGGTSRQETI